MQNPVLLRGGPELRLDKVDARWALVRETVLLHATLLRSGPHVELQPAWSHTLGASGRLGSKLASCPNTCGFSRSLEGLSRKLEDDGHALGRTDNVNVVEVCEQMFIWPHRILHLLQRPMLSQRVQHGHEGISLLVPFSLENHMVVRVIFQRYCED